LEGTVRESEVIGINDRFIVSVHCGVVRARVFRQLKTRAGADAAVVREKMRLQTGGGEYAVSESRLRTDISQGTYWDQYIEDGSTRSVGRLASCEDAEKEKALLESGRKEEPALTDDSRQRRRD